MTTKGGTTKLCGHHRAKASEVWPREEASQVVGALAVPKKRVDADVKRLPVSFQAGSSQMASAGTSGRLHNCKKTRK